MKSITSSHTSHPSEETPSLKIPLKLMLVSLIALIGLISYQARAQAEDIRFSQACTPTDSQVLLSFVGDLLIHEPLHLQAMQDPRRYRGLWYGMEDLIQKADIAFANLEAPVARGLGPRGRRIPDVRPGYDQRAYAGSNFVFNYPPEVLDDLARSGFDVLSTSNNHSLDRGALGIDLTLIEFDRIPGLYPVGTRHRQDPNHSWWVVLERQGLRIAYLACTEMTNGIPDRDHQLLKCGDTQRMTRLLREMKNSGQADAIIVSAHWGDEYVHRPHQRQRNWARAYIDAGADVIVGHHPHVLQPWEKMTSSDGREALVIYSLGNYVSWQAHVPRKTTTQVFVQIGRSGNQSFVQGAVHVPLWMHRGPNEIIPMDRSNQVPTEAWRHVRTHYPQAREQDSRQPINATPECR